MYGERYSSYALPRRLKTFIEWGLALYGCSRYISSRSLRRGLVSTTNLRKNSQTMEWHECHCAMSHAPRVAVKRSSSVHRIVQGASSVRCARALRAKQQCLSRSGDTEFRLLTQREEVKVMHESDTATYEPLWTAGDPPKCYACNNGLTGHTKVCYACMQGLTGAPKGDEPLDDYPLDDELAVDDVPDDEGGRDIWDCRCKVWECRCAECRQTAVLAYCPVCDGRFHGSAHLSKAFADDERTCWLANMVMHYRHHHRKWEAQ